VENHRFLYSKRSQQAEKKIKQKRIWRGKRW